MIHPLLLPSPSPSSSLITLRRCSESPAVFVSFFQCVLQYFLLPFFPSPLGSLLPSYLPPFPPYTLFSLFPFLPIFLPTFLPSFHPHFPPPSHPSILPSSFLPCFLPGDGQASSISLPHPPSITSDVWKQRGRGESQLELEWGREGEEGGRWNGGGEGGGTGERGGGGREVEWGRVKSNYTADNCNLSAFAYASKECNPWDWKCKEACWR